MIISEKAKQAIEASEKKAKELGIAVSTVIVNDHGTQIAMSRMVDSHQEALEISPDFALTKAFTAANLKMPSGDLAPYAVEGKSYFGIDKLFGGKLTTIAGGLPIMKDNKVIGAVGVGGSADVSQDVECAKAAQQVLEA